MKIREGMEQEYATFRDNNTQDGYSEGIINYAERWCDMMEREIKEGTSVAEAAALTEHTADTDGITGFMYGCAVQTLCQFWEYGEELRHWHNSKYDYEGSGVVNPAVITLPDSVDDAEDMLPSLSM